MDRGSAATDCGSSGAALPVGRRLMVEVKTIVSILHSGTIAPIYQTAVIDLFSYTYGVFLFFLF